MRVASGNHNAHICHGDNRRYLIRFVKARRLRTLRAGHRSRGGELTLPPYPSLCKLSGNVRSLPHSPLRARAAHVQDRSIDRYAMLQPEYVIEAVGFAQLGAADCQLERGV